MGEEKRQARPGTFCIIVRGLVLFSSQWDVFADFVSGERGDQGFIVEEPCGLPREQWRPVRSRQQQSGQRLRMVPTMNLAEGMEKSEWMQTY